MIVSKDTASLETTMGNCLNDATSGILTERYKNVQKDPLDGVDYSFEDDKPYPGLPNCPDKPIYLVQFKSAKSWKNSSSWQKLMEQLAAAAKLRGPRAYVVIGHYFGTGSKSIPKYAGKGHQLFGDAFWDFVTGHMDFYSNLYPKLMAQQAKHIQENEQVMKKLVAAAKKQLASAGLLNWDDMMAMAG